MASRQQQVNEVVEGLGLGMAAMGETRVTSAKDDLELALSHAWTRWEHTSDYPLIDRAQRPDDELWAGIRESNRRTNAAVVWREGGGNYVVDIALSNRTPEEAARFVGHRPLSEWTSLAALFLGWFQDGDEEKAGFQAGDE
jgi:hypothetical protein